MNNHHTIELPERIASLPRDSRGYPIPYIIFINDDGKPIFTINDIDKVQQAIAQNLCHICGQPLENLVWFTGGPGSALLNNQWGVYNDGPMHCDCMRFAMAVCPHLSHKMTKAIGPAVAKSLNEKGISTFDTTTIPGVPSIFVSVQTPKFLIARGQFYVPKPYLKVEYWKDGVLVPIKDGRKLAAKAASLLAATL